MKKIIVFLWLAGSTVVLFSQNSGVTVSGNVKDRADRAPLPYVTVLVQLASDSSFVSGTVTSEQGFYTLSELKPGNYLLRTSFVGYEDVITPFLVGRLSDYLDLGTTLMAGGSLSLEGVTVAGLREEITAAMDKKVYTIEDNLTQLGGSVLQAMQNLPGVTVDRDGKLFLRGSDKVSVLIDGKQTAITGMGSQSGLDNIPASAVERIEIIQNPSARFDAGGMAGIVNIIFRKEQLYGWNGRAGLTLGAGALGMKKESLAGIRDQYRLTPKINPSLSANYKKEDVNIFVHGDLLYHKQMMKNEFYDRQYVQSSDVRQQFLENRTQPVYNIRGGIDWTPNARNSLTFSSLFNYREYTDLGDLPYIEAVSGSPMRLWQYYENEVNQTLFTTLTHRHNFLQPGHSVVSSFNYSFRRKDEVFYFTNQQAGIVGTDTTGLIADENIFDLTVDYFRPLRSGRLETGTKQRARIFPNDIYFSPGQNSILDPGLAGTAEYREWLSAVYANYVYELTSLELEAGLRLEYVKVDYLVDPRHTVYESDGFEYFDLFPNVRASWLLSENQRITAFYNRRVDRPEESALRVFPTYADPEILSMGNPGLEPQFTQSLELGYRQSWQQGYVYLAVFHRMSRNLLTRIITEVPGTNRLASISQNAGKGQNTGLEWIFSQRLGSRTRLNANAMAYRNNMGGFTIVNAYPSNISFSRPEQTAWAGNAKLQMILTLPNKFELQFSGTYMAPDLIPQGKILARYWADAGIKREIQQGKGELFLNVSDVFNSLVVKHELQGTGFNVYSEDFYETQVMRLGYQYRF